MSAARHKVAVAVAAGVGLAAAHLFSGVYSGPGAERLLYYTIVGPVAGLLYYYVVAATLERTALWVATCAFGAYMFSDWFVRPVLHYGSLSAAVELGDPAAYAEREEWLEALIAAGRYGGPNVFPPMLDVRVGDTGNVVARNVTDGTLVLSVAIVAADRAASGGWRGCGFQGHAGRGAEEWVELAPGDSAVFELEPVCKEIFLDLAAHTEFRVGNESQAVETGWWTTSALVAPQGRASERASGNAALPSRYDARPFYAALVRGE